MSRGSDVEGGRARAKAERLQAHWAVPGEVAMVYNVRSGTRYQVRTKWLGSKEWVCECMWYRCGGVGPCKHVVRVMDKARLEGLE